MQLVRDNAICFYYWNYSLGHHFRFTGIRVNFINLKSLYYLQNRCKTQILKVTNLIFSAYLSFDIPNIKRFQRYVHIYRAN